jgi:hypothetical protein
MVLLAKKSSNWIFGSKTEHIHNNIDKVGGEH